MDLQDLRAYDHNPRSITPAARAGLDASVRRFGDISGIVYNRRLGALVSGHQRMSVLRERGVDQVERDEGGAFVRDPETGEVFRIRVVDWDEATHRAACVAANSQQLMGDFTAEVFTLMRDVRTELPDLFGDLRLGELVDGLKAALGDLELPATGDHPGVDEAPEPAPEAFTRPGDLWLLGDHRLLCGDSTKLDDVDHLMNGELANLVATDPPYLVDYTGERPADAGKDWTSVYHEVAVKDAEAFFSAVFANVVRVLAPHAAIYCWHAHKRLPTLIEVWRRLGILDHQQVLWVKPAAVLSTVFWHYRHEPCLMGWLEGSKPPHDGRHDGTSVWDVDWEGAKRVTDNEHPTQKPVELFARPMRKHTRPGDVCFEPFCGSGSQLIAAEQLGRRCYAIELEPVFVDVAIRRWCKHTGKNAIREDGSVFPMPEE